MSTRQNVPKTKCPQDKISPRQNDPWQNVSACLYCQTGTFCHGTFCSDKTSPLAYIAKRKRFVWTNRPRTKRPRTKRSRTKRPRTKRPRTKHPRTMSLDKIVGIGLVIREKEKVQHTRLLLFFHLKTDYSTLASLLELLRSHIGLLFFASGKAFYVVGVFWVLQVLA